MDGEGGGHALILGGDGDVAGLAVLIGHQCGLAVLIQVGNGGIGDAPGEAFGAVDVVLAGEGKAILMWSALRMLLTLPFLLFRRS